MSLINKVKPRQLEQATAGPERAEEYPVVGGKTEAALEERRAALEGSKYDKFKNEPANFGAALRQFRNLANRPKTHLKPAQKFEKKPLEPERGED